MIISILGIWCLWNKEKPKRKDIRLYIVYILCHLGVLLSVLFFGSNFQMLFYHIGLAFFVFPFFHSYFVRYGLTRYVIYGIAFCVLPGLFPQYFSGDNKMASDVTNAIDSGSRFTGLSGDPNYTVLGLACPFIGALFLSQSGNVFNRFLWTIVCVIIIFSFLAAGSRAGIGSIMCSLTAFIVLIGHNRWRTILLFVPIVMVGMLMSSSIIGRYLRVFVERTGGSISSFLEDNRYEIWHDSFFLVINSPLVNNVQDNDLINKYNMVAHNVFLDIGLTYGSMTMLIHTIVWIAATVIIVRKIRSASKFSNIIPQNLYAFVGLICLSVLIIAVTLSIAASTLYWFVYTLCWSVCFSRPLSNHEYNYTTVR